MFSFSRGQWLVEHILIDISCNYGWKLCERKKWYLMKRMGKVVRDRPFEEKRKKEKLLHCVLKVLCWWSLKSKEFKYWCFKMVNLCVLMIYLVSKFIFIECSTSFGFNLFFFSFLLPHLNLSLITTESKTF